MILDEKGNIIWTNIEQRSYKFKFFCWLALQRWYQFLLIPYHIVLGFYHKYTVKEIFDFVIQVIKEK